jgi:NAD(P)-dependent dehydrogenase (short-subunit alcohol dehydrogenase family)
MARTEENGLGRLAGRTAIVTGGANGIGLHYSRTLAAEGAGVVIADISGGEKAADELAAKYGANATMAVTCDVTREDQVKALMDKTVERFGKIDILVNNAALFAPLVATKVQDIDVDLWDKVFAVNVRGSFLTVKHAAPHMIARKYGKIINIGSGVVYKGLPGYTHYSASKGAIATFTRTLSRELGEHGICINTLAPGLVMSETLVAANTYDEATQARVVATRAFKRDQYPEDLLGALIFLSSAESDFITGQTIAVDGGSVNL